MIIKLDKNDESIFNSAQEWFIELQSGNLDPCFGFEPIENGMTVTLKVSHENIKLPISRYREFCHVGEFTTIKCTGIAAVHSSNYSLSCELLVTLKITLTDDSKDDCYELVMSIVDLLPKEVRMTQPIVTENGHKKPHTVVLSHDSYLYGILMKCVNSLTITSCEINITINMTTVTTSYVQAYRIDDYVAAQPNDAVKAKYVPQPPQKPEDVPKVAEAGLDMLTKIHEVIAVRNYAKKLLTEINEGSGIDEIVGMLRDKITDEEEKYMEILRHSDLLRNAMIKQIQEAADVLSKSTTS